METMTFPRYSPDDIISYLRSHILQGAEARNLVKGDVFGSPRVREGGAGRLRAVLARPGWRRGWVGRGWAGLGACQEARCCHQQHGLSSPALWRLGKTATASRSDILPDPFSASKPASLLSLSFHSKHLVLASEEKRL